MPVEERTAIIKELHCVDSVIQFDDSDDSACDAIEQLLNSKSSDHALIFANGGDRTNTNTPEYKRFGDRDDVAFVFGVGGEDKKNSSSWILEEWHSPKTQRPWGYYQVLYTCHQNQTKVKKLVVQPGKSMSMQKHKYRNEIWMVAEGVATVNFMTPDQEVIYQSEYNKHEVTSIPANSWHQITNMHDKTLVMIEIQHGEQCKESDITRKS